MKHNRTHGGTRIALRLTVYAVTFLAIIGIRESLIHDGGPLSESLGRIFNRSLMASSKIGLGLAEICEDHGVEGGLVSRNGRILNRAAHKAFIDAAKFDIYGK